MSFTILLLLVVGARSAAARTWKDVSLMHSVYHVDDSGPAFLQDVFDSEWDGSVSGPVPAPSTLSLMPSTDVPSPLPSSVPTMGPTLQPSTVPTTVPSVAPSPAPSVSPTRSLAPSAAPLAPSTAPTRSPTVPPVMDPFLPLPPPDRPERGYFNYDASSPYGPRHWDKVEHVSNDYWSEFGPKGFGVWKGVLQNHQLDENMCARGEFQSPIDVRDNGAECFEFHEIRDNAGEFALSEDEVDKQIQSNKLRLVYPRRACPNVDDPQCRNYDLPLADFPNGWTKTADVLHVDFKLRAEHLIRGESFDAELQIFHLHPTNRRVAALSTLIRVAQVGGYNAHLQPALDAFQRVYDDHKAQCLRTQPNAKAVRSHFKSTHSTHFNATSRHGHRDLTVWNPYHEMLIPTIHFFRYDGSLTEPPCSEFVSWFISDQPMMMSAKQFDQWRTIQFTHVDAQCRSTSIHADQSVARPIQPTHGRKIWVCTPSDFGKDP